MGIHLPTNNRKPGFQWLTLRECIPLTEVWSGCQPWFNSWIVCVRTSVSAQSLSFPQASHLWWLQDLCCCSETTSRFKAGGQEGDWTNHIFAYMKKSTALWTLPCVLGIRAVSNGHSSRKRVLKAYVLMWQMHCYPEQDWHSVYREENSNIIGWAAHTGGR